MRDHRTRALWIAVAVALVAATPAAAQVFHQYPGAVPVSDTEPALGGAVGFGDNIVRITGYGRFNVSELSDLGIEIVFDHWDPDFGDSGWRLGAGADFRYAIVPSGRTLPFDLSLDGGLGFQSGNDITNFHIPFGGIISRPLELRNHHILVPYGGLYVVFSHVSFDTPPGIPDQDDSELDVELRLGTSIEFTDGIAGFVNVHIGDDEMFFLGVNASL
jgi:hypothetical protein